MKVFFGIRHSLQFLALGVLWAFFSKIGKRMLHCDPAVVLSAYVVTSPATIDECPFVELGVQLES